jgi:hypothetical protein
MAGVTYKKSGNSGGGLDFEAQLWAAADKMRGHKVDLVPVRNDLANPPFSMNNSGGENLRQDVRWKFEMPPVNNANDAWIQHFIHPFTAIDNVFLLRHAKRLPFEYPQSYHPKNAKCVGG